MREPGEMLFTDFPVNPNDGQRYVWSYHNDEYVRIINKPANQAHPKGWLDFEPCRTYETKRVGTSRQLMRAFGLALNAKDQCTDKELDAYGKATIFYDTRGRALGFCHEVGIVASIPEWSNVDWENIHED